MVEQHTVNVLVGGSSPPFGAKYSKDNFLPKFVVLSMTETTYQILKEINYV